MKRTLYFWAGAREVWVPWPRPMTDNVLDGVRASLRKLGFCTKVVRTDERKFKQSEIASIFRVAPERLQ